jgi:hypothetical protein
MHEGLECAGKSVTRSAPSVQRVVASILLKPRICHVTEKLVWARKRRIVGLRTQARIPLTDDSKLLKIRVSPLEHGGVPCLTRESPQYKQSVLVA